MATDDVESGRVRSRTLRRIGLPTVPQMAFITLCAVLGLLSGLVAASRPDKYQSNAQVFVTAVGVEGANGLQSTNTYILNRVQGYTSVVTSPSVLDPVIKQLNLSGDSAALAKKISADAPLNSNLVNIHATDSRASEAQAIATAVTTSFISFIQKTETKVGPKQSALVSVLRFSEIHPASLPTGPKSPPRLLYLLIGLLVGFLVGALLVVVYTLLRRRLGNTHDLDLLDNAPLVGLLPYDKRSQDMTVFTDPADRRTEPYRLLRTNLVFGDIDQHARIIAVTGPQGGEGVSTVAVNLAAALAELGLDVCLLECDQRKPSLGERFGVDTEVGLSAVLNGGASVEDVKQDSGAGFSVVTAGARGSDPTRLLDASQLRAAFVDAAGAGYVVVDAPPLLPFAGGAEAARVADVTLVVVRARKTLRIAFDRAVGGLEQSGTYGGVILNAATGRGVQRRARQARPLPSRRTPVGRADASSRRPASGQVNAPTQFPFGRADVAGRAPLPVGTYSSSDFRPPSPARSAASAEVGQRSPDSPVSQEPPGSPAGSESPGGPGSRVSRRRSQRPATAEDAAHETPHEGLFRDAGSN